MASGSTNRRLIYGLIVAVALAATLFGVSNGRILGVTPAPTPLPTPTGSADPLVAQPAPDLFKDLDLLPVRTALRLQDRRAVTNIDRFYDDQPRGRAVDDAAFVRWAARQVSPVPSFGQRQFERAALLHFKHSAKKDDAAGWLGLHGCRDVWVSFALEQSRFHAAGAPAASQTELASVLDLAGRVAAAAHNRLARAATTTPPPPCTPATPQPPPEGCSCSYPSGAAAMSAAARMYLAALEPRSTRRYAWMEQQVDMAALYQGLQLPSDVKAGAYLGYLTGVYFLAARGHGSLIPRPTPTPTTRTV
jgi:hypothetical protein